LANGIFNKGTGFPLKGVLYQRYPSIPLSEEHAAIKGTGELAPARRRRSLPIPCIKK